MRETSLGGKRLDNGGDTFKRIVIVVVIIIVVFFFVGIRIGVRDGTWAGFWLSLNGRGGHGLRIPP